jgi:hypothetical protein
MADFAHPDVERAKTLLRPMMPDKFDVIYTPDMPGHDGRQFRWFQVVFVVGPGDGVILRSQIHELFPRMLAAISPLALVSDTDHISLRARRFMPDSALGSDHPFMFIEADWIGSAVRQMREHDDFSHWADESLTYHNRFDRVDTFSKQMIA